MIRLVRAHIENYKGITDMRIDFPQEAGESVFPVIGLNESGKTTILEALTFVNTTKEDLSALEFAGLRKQESHHLIPVSARTSFTGRISVGLSMTTEEEDRRYIQEEFSRQTGYGLAHVPNEFLLTSYYEYENAKFIKSAGRYELDVKYEKKKHNQKKPDFDALWPVHRYILEGRLPSLLYVPNFLFDFPEQLPLTADPETTRPRDAFFHRLLDGLLKLEDPKLSFADNIIARATATSPEIRQSFLSALTKLEYALNKHVLSHWELIGGKKLQGLATSLAVETVDGAPVLVVTLKHKGDPYRISERSLGFRWFFTFLMLTFFAKSLGTKRQTVYLLDEPASNLHATAQTRLLHALRNISGAMFVYSTHSHYLLDPDLLPSTLVARNAGYDPENDDDFVAAQTNISAIPFRQFVSKHPRQTEHFQVALDVLDVPVTSLEISFPCFFTEGKSDWYYLRLAEMCGVFGKHKAYPFGGVNTIDARVNAALSEGRQFAVLVNGDTRISEKLGEQYGMLFTNRCVSLRDVLGAGKKGEDLFDAADRIAVIQSAGLKGTSKAVFQRASELCVAGKRQTKLSKATRDRFAALEKALSAALS